MRAAGSCQAGGPGIVKGSVRRRSSPRGGYGVGSSANGVARGVKAGRRCVPTLHGRQQPKGGLFAERGGKMVQREGLNVVDMMSLEEGPRGVDPKAGESRTQ